MSVSKKQHRLVWVDLEMTGLDDKKCHIIEMATIITDLQLNEIATQEMVIWQPESVLESMGPFVRNMHTKNGLLEKVRASQISLEDAENKALRFLQEHVDFRTGYLAGNTIWQDRRFMLRYMPLVEKYLHYRMVDVSSIKILAQDWYQGKKNKPNGVSDHTAMSDIRNSIAELKHYRENIFVTPEDS